MGSYVISDIHGCYDELIRMFEKINLGDSDTLICAGDYVDKGPKNAEVLEWIMNNECSAKCHSATRQS